MTSQTAIPDAPRLPSIEPEAQARLPWEGPNSQPFSWSWVAASVVVFITLEVGLAYLAGTYLLAHYVSQSLHFQVEGGIGLLSYFLGGFLIAVVSPKVRMLEPAVGAVVALVASLSVALFTPVTFLQFQLSKLLLGGVLAFAVAMWGAHLGEKLTRQI